MSTDSLLNILNWCGYQLEFKTILNDLGQQFYQSVCRCNNTGLELVGSETATYEYSIRSAIGKVIQHDPVVATIIALVSVGIHTSSYKNDIEKLRLKYTNN